MKVRNLIAGVLFCVVPTVSVAQIPTTDVAAIAQMVQQLMVMKRQVQSLQSQYEALTGSSGIGGFLSGSPGILRQNLPENWKNVYADALGGQSGITGPAVSMTDQFKQRINSMPAGQALALIEKKRQRKGAYDRVMAARAYNNQMRELDNMTALTQQINSATSMKEIADLQARIQTAQGTIQAEQVKLQLMAMLQESQDKLLRMQQGEAEENYLVGDALQGGSWNFPDITP